MDLRPLGWAALAAFAFLLVPAGARAADEPGAAASTDDDPTAGLRGFEIMIRPSFGSAPATSPVRFEPDGAVRVQGDGGAIMQGAPAWGSGFVGSATAGYRFLPLLSAGLRAGIRTSSASSVSDGSRDLSRASWDAGFYVRAYPLATTPSVSRYVDPWVSVGVGYARDVQTFTKSVPTTLGTSVDASWTLDHHAVVVPLAIGVDYRVTRFLSLGPSFELSLANAVAACSSQAAPAFAGTSYCSNSEPGSHFVAAKTYAVWSVGADVKVTF
jgi:hypothetical protein